MNETFEEMMTRITNTFRLKLYDTEGLMSFAKRLRDELSLERERVSIPISRHKEICDRMESIVMEH